MCTCIYVFYLLFIHDILNCLISQQKIYSISPRLYQILIHTHQILKMRTPTVFDLLCNQLFIKPCRFVPAFISGSLPSLCLQSFLKIGVNYKPWHFNNNKRKNDRAPVESNHKTAHKRGATKGWYYAWDSEPLYYGSCCRRMINFSHAGLLSKLDMKEVLISKPLSSLIQLKNILPSLPIIH